MLSDVRRKLQEVISLSYAPYSSFPVAAAVVCFDGTLFEGINIENAAYGSGVCAERIAMYHAYIHGKRKKDIKMLVLYTPKTQLIYPCGACLQVMNELLDKECEVVVMNDRNEKMYQVKELLPYTFDKEDLNEL